MDITFGMLESMATRYGDKDGLSFLKGQYNNPYYSTLRTAGEMQPQKSDVEFEDFIPIDNSLYFGKDSSGSLIPDEMTDKQRFEAAQEAEKKRGPWSERRWPQPF